VDSDHIRILAGDDLRRLEASRRKLFAEQVLEHDRLHIGVGEPVLAPEVEREVLEDRPRLPLVDRRDERLDDRSDVRDRVLTRRGAAHEEKEGSRHPAAPRDPASSHGTNIIPPCPRSCSPSSLALPWPGR
jgi:hypothetical protein